MVTEEAPGGSACLKHSKHSKHSQHSQHSQSSKDLERSWKILKGDQSRRRYAVGVARTNAFSCFFEESWVTMRCIIIEMYYMRCSFPHQAVLVVIWGILREMVSQHISHPQRIGKIWGEFHQFSWFAACVSCRLLQAMSRNGLNRLDASVFFGFKELFTHWTTPLVFKISLLILNHIAHWRIFVTDWLIACNSTSQQVVAKMHID